MRAFAPLLFASGFVVACSSSTTPTVPVDTVTVEQACTDYISAYCDQIDKCAPFFLQLVYGDLATCKTRAVINCPKIFEANGTSVTPTKAAACAKDIKSVSCADLFGGTPPASCTPEPGKLADGNACGDDAQCVSTFCSKLGQTCGVCGKPPAIGSPCKEDHDCGRGVSCSDKKAGTGTCRKTVPVGATCDTNNPCSLGNACVAGKCSAALAAGVACDPAASACDLSHGLYCHPTDKVCKLVTIAKAGQTCGLNDATKDITLCAGAAECSSFSPPGTCGAIAADGAACDDAKGPHCIPPAVCAGGQCKLPDPTACK